MVLREGGVVHLMDMKFEERQDLTVGSGGPQGSLLRAVARRGHWESACHAFFRDLGASYMSVFIL
jgi:hypothetical protein